MALDLLAHVVEFVFGPLFLLVHFTELGAVLGDVGMLLELLTTGEVAGAVEAILAGDVGVATRMLASTAGTLLWVAVFAGAMGAFGEFGEFGEAGELLELFG